jgi:hypothetical protein
MAPAGANEIKLFADVIYRYSNKTRVLVTGKSFQPSLMYAVEAGAPFLCSTLG